MWCHCRQSTSSLGILYLHVLDRLYPHFYDAPEWSSTIILGGRCRGSCAPCGSLLDGLHGSDSLLLDLSLDLLLGGVLQDDALGAPVDGAALGELQDGVVPLQLSEVGDLTLRVGLGLWAAVGHTLDEVTVIVLDTLGSTAEGEQRPFLARRVEVEVGGGEAEAGVIPKLVRLQCPDVDSGLLGEGEDTQAGDHKNLHDCCC